MGIPGLGKAIGNADRIALSRLAVRHLEVARRPLRVAVDISIWLFQLQAGRGGQNPELRTLFFRLVRLLALPVHPLFVYDGRQKPPFKRGKATTGRSYGSAPIISLSKILIDLFKFPRHDAPGEAEAECARLQQAGVVDAVMSNDIDTLMFGSGFTVMNYSKEGSTGTTAATHVDCYTTETRLDVEANVKLSRPGMVLFAMLSGGDYLPSGITKCGPGLAGEIAKAGFGEDLFEIIDSNEGDLESKLAEWRERLQYELDENESGYFQCKHKAVRIPDTFPDRQILSFYAKPIVSNDKDIEKLRQRLVGAWDHEIDALELRKFVGNYFDWKYRSGARKLVRSLAEPVLLTRLRLARSPVAPFGYGSYTPNTDLPVLQRIYRSRMHFSTGCVPQVQLEMVPIDIVGLDLDAEEPNPPPEWSQATESNTQPVDDADVEGIGAEVNTRADAGPNASKIDFARHPYNPFEPEKIWVFETVANLGIPDVLARWKQQEAEKKMPKKPVSKSTTTKTKKKKVIDPTMKPGGILRYTTVTKLGGDMNSAKKSQILDAVGLLSSPQIPSSQTTHSSQYSAWSDTGDTSNAVFPNQFRHGLQLKKSAAASMDELTGHFATSCMIGDERVGSPGDSYFRCPPLRTLDWDHLETDMIPESLATISPSPTRFKLSYTATSSLSPIRTENVRHVDLLPSTGSPTPKSRRSKDFRSQQSLEVAFESLNLSPISQQSAAAMIPGKEKPRKLKLDARTRSRQMEDIQAVEASADLEMDRCETRVHSSRKAINRNKQTEEIQDITPNTRLKAASETEIREDEVRDHHQSQHQQSNTVTETIRASKGFWTVEVHEEQKSKSICSDNETAREKNSIKQSSKKERIARVSVVDMR